MTLARIALTMLLAISLAASTGCREPSVDSNRSLGSAVDQPSQSRQDETGQSSDGNESTATSERQSGDADRRESDLRVDVDKEGVDVKVGEAIDVTVGEQGVDVDVRPDRTSSDGGASDVTPKK